MNCNFGDADKIKAMISEKYEPSDFVVSEYPCVLSSLNDIEISEKGRVVLRLEATSKGYIITEIDEYMPLEFVSDVYNSIVV